MSNRLASFTCMGVSLLRVGSSSLLWPMILNAAVDLSGGAVGRRVMTAERGHDA